MNLETFGYFNFYTMDVPWIKNPKRKKGGVMGFSWRPYQQGHRLTCYFSRCKITVFEEKRLASEPFVKEHVDVNVHLPQMFTELLLNKLFVPYLFSVMVSVFLFGWFLFHLGFRNQNHLTNNTFSNWIYKWQNWPLPNSICQIISRHCRPAKLWSAWSS